MKPIQVPELTPHQRRGIAVDACVCERTLQRYLADQTIRSTCRARIEAALHRFLSDRDEIRGSSS